MVIKEHPLFNLKIFKVFKIIKDLYCNMVIYYITVRKMTFDTFFFRKCKRKTKFKSFATMFRVYRANSLKIVISYS